MKKEEVVLVDEQDNDVGTEEKIAAHEQGGKLHRAFSVFIFNSQGEMLLQQRAKTKYHCGGLWTNTCCSHPRPGEPVEQAAHRRLREEMGFDTELRKVTSFVYKASFDNGLTEHELDHVFVGRYDGEIKSDPGEVESHRWIKPEELLKDIGLYPDNYTPWFKKILSKVLEARGFDASPGD